MTKKEEALKTEIEMLKALARGERPAPFYGYQPVIRLGLLGSAYKALSAKEQEAIQDYMVGKKAADQLRERCKVNVKRIERWPGGETVIITGKKEKRE